MVLDGVVIMQQLVWCFPYKISGEVIETTEKGHFTIGMEIALYITKTGVKIKSLLWEGDKLKGKKI